MRIRALGCTLCAVLGIAACDSGGEQGGSASVMREIPQPTRAELAAAGLDKLPLAPSNRRLDIAAPTFPQPTRITNPLFPIRRLRSVVFSGRVEGKRFHTETTLLPETRIIEWSPGQAVRSLVSQYMAYIDGRVEEVALDYYAQADDGSVWYLGEDVYDYDGGGRVDSTLGSWLAGREGPAQMIMPAHPKVEDVHRAENIPGIAFEEVEIKKTGVTVNGPRGRVHGALVARELHDDGSYSDKIFAPGYGEFFSGHGDEVEALALAVPTDALEGSPPEGLEALSRLAMRGIGPSRAGKWKAALNELDAAARAWTAYRRRQVPPRIASELGRALSRLRSGIGKRDRAEAGTAAIDAAQSALDLKLQYLPPTEVDRGRFQLWATQVLVDAAAGNVGGVRSDVTAMEWIRDRFAHGLKPADRTALDAHLVALRDSVAFESENLRAAGVEASELREQLAPAPGG